MASFATDFAGSGIEAQRILSILRRMRSRRGHPPWRGFSERVLPERALVYVNVTILSESRGRIEAASRRGSVLQHKPVSFAAYFGVE